MLALKDSTVFFLKTNACSVLRVKCNHCWMNWQAKPSSQLNWRISIDFSGYAAYRAGRKFGPLSLKGRKLFRPLFFYNVIQVKKIPTLCNKYEQHATESALPSPLSPLMKTVIIFCDLQCVLFVWCSSSSGGLSDKNQIWQIRLIMMQMQNAGCWWACCHKCSPRSCRFFFCPVFRL